MKLLVADLDGALYPKKDKEGALLARNIAALNKWYRQGNIVVIATSRGIGHLDELKRKLTIPFTFIGANGAIIVDEAGNVAEKTFKACVYNEIVKEAANDKLNLSVTTIYDGNWYWSTKEAYPIKGATKIRTAWQYIIQREELDPSLPLTQIKILIPKEELARYKDHLKSKYPDLSIVSSNKDTIDIQAQEATKGAAIKDIIQDLDLSIDDVFAVGDSENDIAMFELVPNSYCMKDGDAVAKCSARYLIDTVSDLIDSEV